jgi:hypothetical protein
MTDKQCECGGEMTLNRQCGVRVCDECGKHDGLARCYCGWSETSPGHGREELEDMGEVIDEEGGLS